MLRPWTVKIQLERKSNKAIYLQIADCIIDIIKNGTMKSGDALPSSRQLALKLDVNRNTVVKALDILLAEGWISSEERRGIFVSAYLPITKDEKKKIIEEKEYQLITKPTISFDTGLPDTHIAPIEDLARAYRRIFSRKARFNLMMDVNELGAIDLRNTVSKMLNQTRGMHTDFSQICITRGSQMALFLLAHSLLDTGDIILVENPGYEPAWATFRHAKAELIPVDVDKDGISIDKVEEILTRKKIKAVYITPHHQFPTTVIMSLERRLRLIELSNQYGFTIIEDDYDSDFHFGQRPIAPLASLNGINNYIYIGTFSKMISASLRVGYLVADIQTIKKISKLRRIIDLQGDNIMEQAILELIESGIMRKHIRKAAKLYLKKRDLFSILVDTYLSDKVRYTKPEGGLAFWLELNKKQNLEKLNQELKKQNVIIAHPSKYSFDNKTNGIRLGYASLSDTQLEQGLKIMSEVIK